MVALCTMHVMMMFRTATLIQSAFSLAAAEFSCIASASMLGLMRRYRRNGEEKLPLVPVGVSAVLAFASA